MTLHYMLISFCLMYLARANQNFASQIRQGTRHRQSHDRPGSFAALVDSKNRAKEEQSKFIRSYSSCEAPPDHKCVLVHFLFDCDHAACRIQPIDLKAANHRHAQKNQTQPRELNEDDKHHLLDLSVVGGKADEGVISVEASDDGSRPTGEDLFSRAVSKLCERVGLKCTAGSIPLIGPFIEGFIQSGAADFLPKLPPATEADLISNAASLPLPSLPLPAVAPAGRPITTTVKERLEGDVVSDDEMIAAAERLGHSHIRSGSVALPMILEQNQRLLSAEATELKAAAATSPLDSLLGDKSEASPSGGKSEASLLSEKRDENPFASLMRLVEGEGTSLSPLTPRDSFRLDGNGVVNPFLSNLPTIRPPPVSMRADQVPFDNWLSRVKLPPNVRAATSGMELLRAVESKSLELFLSVARVPLSVTANAFRPPPALAMPTLPVFDRTKMDQEADAADLIARLQAQAMLRYPQSPFDFPPQSAQSNNHKAGEQRRPQHIEKALLAETRSALTLAEGWTGRSADRPRDASEFAAEEKSTNAAAEEPLLVDDATGGGAMADSKAATTAPLKKLQELDNVSLKNEAALKRLQQFGPIDSILGLLSPFLPGGGALEADSVVSDDSYLDELDPAANAVSTSDLLPWLPVDSVAASLPSWLIESLMGPYALLFEDFVRIAQDGFIRMQLVFDTFADEPIPVTARGIEQFSEQMAEAFRATPAGDEADALKSMALTVRQLPTFMPDGARQEEGREQSPLLDIYDDWVKQVTRNRRLRINEVADSVSSRLGPDARPMGPSKTVVFLSERTTSDNLPWLPMDEVVGGLPSFYLDKLGKPGAALKKVAGAWLSGAEKVDKATKSVLDPLISLTGGSHSDSNKKSSSSNSDWDREENSYGWGDDDKGYGWNGRSSSSGGGSRGDDRGYSSRGDSRSKSSTSKSDDSDNNNSILDTFGNLISGLLGQRTSLFLEAEHELANARLGILEGLQLGPTVLNDATVSLVSSVPDVLLSLYNPFPEIESPEATRRTLENFIHKLEKPTPDAEKAQDDISELKIEIERSLQTRARELSRLLRQLRLSPLIPNQPSTQPTRQNEQWDYDGDEDEDVDMDYETPPGTPLGPSSPLDPLGLFRSLELPSLFESQSPMHEVPDALRALNLDKPIVLPSIEELDEALRVTQENLERALMQLGLLPIKLDGQMLPSFLIGQDSTSKLFNSITDIRSNASRHETSPKRDETPPVREETPHNGDETTHGGDETSHGGDETSHGGDETSHGGDETSHGGDETAPGGDETAPGGDETAPGGDRRPVSGEDETAPGGDRRPVSGERSFMQISSLPDFYEESFAMYERAIQDRWRFIKDYNRLLYKSNPLAAAQFSPPSLSPSRQVAENVSPSMSRESGRETSAESGVSAESHATSPLEGWYNGGMSPTRHTVDGMAGLLGSLLDSVTYTGGEMLGTFAQRFVPIHNVGGPTSPQVGILSAQIDVSTPHIGDNNIDSKAEIAELTAKLKEALTKASDLISITERLDTLIADRGDPPTISTKRRVLLSEQSETSLLQEQKASVETETPATVETETPASVETETSATDGEATSVVKETKRADHLRRLAGEKKLKPWFIKPEGVEEDADLTPSQLLIGMLEAANVAHYDRMNEVVVPPLKLSIPPQLDLRVKLADIQERMRQNEQLGNVGLMMNQDLNSFAHWALARGLLNRASPAKQRRRLDTQSQVEPPILPHNTEHVRQPPPTNDKRTPTGAEGETETPATETETPATTSEGHWVQLEGIFDTLFGLISDGVSDLSRTGDPKEAAKNSAASFIRSISDTIVSSGPSIKDEPEGAVESMEEKRPHRGEKCVNNSNCRFSHSHVTDGASEIVQKDSHRHQQQVRHHWGPPSNPTPQGSITLSPSMNNDNMLFGAENNPLTDNDGYRRRSYY